MRTLSRIMSLVIVVFALLGVTACKNGLFGGEKAPISVGVEHIPFNRNFTEHYVVIKSVADKVTVTGVSINRGNCESLGKEYLPLNFKFGEAKKFLISGACNVTEIAISTDNGDWPFTFDK